MQRELETSLAKGLLRGEFGEEDTVIVEAPGGAQGKTLTLQRRGSDATKPIVDDSLDIDVSKDSFEDNGTNGLGSPGVAEARF